MKTSSNILNILILLHVIQVFVEWALTADNDDNGINADVGDDDDQ